jgi:hypothetical protein
MSEQSKIDICRAPIQAGEYLLIGIQTSESLNGTPGEVDEGLILNEYGICVEGAEIKVRLV